MSTVSAIAREAELVFDHEAVYDNLIGLASQACCLYISHALRVLVLQLRRRCTPTWQFCCLPSSLYSVSWAYLVAAQADTDGEGHRKGLYMGTPDGAAVARHPDTAICVDQSYVFSKSYPAAALICMLSSTYCCP